MPQSDSRFRNTFAQWDGQWYQKIASEGYSYDSKRMSSVAFFPLYPLLGRAVAAMGGLPVDIALLIVSHVFLLMGLTIFAIYLSHGEGQLARPPPLGLWCLALFPTAFFMFMAYSESLFLTLVALTMLGLRQRWTPLALALLVGLATATRPVGVALLPPLLHYVWRERAPSWRGVLTCVWILPVALSGLLAYMVYQHVAFESPLAFAQTQTNWSRLPPLPRWEQMVVLLSGEPIWSVYIPGWPSYWGRVDRCGCAFASLQAANPILFMLAMVALVVGWGKRYLNGHELVLGAGLLLIPYVTRGYEMSMSSQGRFVLVALPVFVVMQRVLASVPPFWRVAWLCASGAYVFVYSWMWTKGYVLI